MGILSCVVLYPGIFWSYFVYALFCFLLVCSVLFNVTVHHWHFEGIYTVQSSSRQEVNPCLEHLKLNKNTSNVYREGTKNTSLKQCHVTHRGLHALLFLIENLKTLQTAVKKPLNFCTKHSIFRQVFNFMNSARMSDSRN